MDQRERESHYTAQMLEDIPVGIALLDAGDFHLISANRCFRTLLGNASISGGNADHRPESLDLLSLFSFPALPLARESFRRTVETGQQHLGSEFPVLHAERGITYWNGSINPIYDEQGKLSQLLITASEVTEQVKARKQAEEQQKSQQTAHIEVDTEFRRLAVIETIARSVRRELDSKEIARVATEALVETFDPICICIHIARPACQILSLVHIYIDQNDPATAALQQGATELERIPYDSPLWLARARNYHEPILLDDLRQVRKASNQFPAWMPPTSGYICIPLWFKDHFEGTLVVLFRETISANSLVVRALVDCSTYISAALAHSRLLADVENERARLRAVLDHLPEGILLVEAKGKRTSYANEAAALILNVPRETLHALSLEELHAAQPRYFSLARKGQEIDSTGTPLPRALEGETILGEEIQCIRADGIVITLLVAAAPIRNETGVITGAASIFQDITARKSIEQQKNEFLSIASHELLTPTTAIQGFAEILQILASEGRDLYASQALQIIENILEQSARQTRLIEELLDLSRIEHTQFLFHQAPHDLVSTLRQAVENMAVLNQQRTIRITLQGLAPHETLFAECDEGRILQVLNNLISNALKYSQPNSEVEVGLRYESAHPGTALLWVRDSGIGIPPGDLPHVFERFHRAENFDRSISGLGIGLYLAHEIIVRHGGSIRVESQVGVGSTFFVELPLHQPETL